MKLSFTVCLRILFFINICTYNYNLLAFTDPGKRAWPPEQRKNERLTVVPLVEQPTDGKPDRVIASSTNTLENPTSLPGKLPRLISERPFWLAPKQSLQFNADPVRFLLTANKANVTVGEEIELTIQAVLLDIPPSLLYVFEEQKSFSLKLLVPQGFEITGGTYFDLVSATLDPQINPSAEYTVKGKFTQYSAEPFVLLRGPKAATAQTLFEKKAELLNPLQVPCSLQADQIVVFAPLEGSLVIQVPKNPTSYLYSLDNINFFPSNYFPRITANQGQVFVREKQNPSCWVVVDYSFLPIASKPVKGVKGSTPQAASPLSDSPCDDPSAKPFVTEAGGLLSVYNCTGTPIWLLEGIYLPNTMGENHIIACNVGGNGIYTAYCNTSSGGCADQSSDPVVVTSCSGGPGGPGGSGGPGNCTNTQPQWEDVGAYVCAGTRLDKLQEDKNACSPTFGQTQWVLVNLCGCNNGANWQVTGGKRCDASTNYQEEQEERDIVSCSPTYNQTRWTPTGQNCPPPANPDWQPTGAVRCDASTNYQQEREERDVAQGSSSHNQTRWTQTGQSCTPGANWQGTGNFRCDASTGYFQEREEQDVAQGSPSHNQTRWVRTNNGNDCFPPIEPNWQPTGAVRCDASTNYQQEREEQDIAQGSPSHNNTRWVRTNNGNDCFPPIEPNWQSTGNLRCDASTGYFQEQEEQDIAQGSPSHNTTRWTRTGQTCSPGADWQPTGVVRCDASTNYQQEREERDVAQGSSTYDLTRWTQTGQTCTPNANWQGTGNFRCDASTGYFQEREEQDVAQGSPSHNNTRWVRTNNGNDCFPPIEPNWQPTGAVRCDASTGYFQEREEQDIAQGSPSHNGTRWTRTGQSCTPGANWQPTGAVRCDASTNYQQEREERDVAQSSSTYDLTRWTQTGQSCTPGADWQGTGNFRCDASTGYFQEREEQDIAQGSPSHNQTRWVRTNNGNDCFPPIEPNWQPTGNLRCDASTGYFQEREEQDLAQGSPSHNTTRWTRTGQSCSPGANWQPTGAVRCDASTNYQQEREEHDVAQGSSTYDLTRWTQTGQSCTPGADWQGTGNFRCDASTGYFQEREEQDVAQGSLSHNQTRWVRTNNGNDCFPPIEPNWQPTGNLRCDASTNFQQEREERDVAQGSSTYDLTRWTQTSQTCSPGANWQGTGNFRCDASTGYFQEREEQDIAQGSPSHNQTRWVRTNNGNDCFPPIEPNWQPTGNLRCDASTGYFQEREEQDLAQGSLSQNNTRWTRTGQTCTPGADWQPTGAVRCDASSNYQQEREERDVAQGSSTYDLTRWTQTGQSCNPDANWQGTGNFRCNQSANRLEREEEDLNPGSSTHNQTRWVLTDDCCSISAPTLQALPTSISGPQSITLTATGCDFNVAWSGPGGTSTGAVLIVTLSQTTTFTARCVDGSCQSPTASVTVQRITVPAPIIRTSGTALCQGDSLQLDADGCEGQVHWSNGMTGNRIRFVPTATTTYSATCVVSNVASEASNAIGILVQTAPTGASATTGQTPYTTGQTISLSATAAGATRYEWSGPGGFMATGQSVNRPSASVAMSGSYTVRAYSGAACPAVATVSVTVQPSVNCTLAFDGEPLADCDFSAADTTRRGRITVKVKNANASGQLQIALYQPVANGGYQLTAILPNSPAVFTGLQQGTYRIEVFEVMSSDTCRADSRLVTLNPCDTTASSCNIRIKAIDSQGSETDVLPRVGGQLGSLQLSVEHLEGTSLAGYTYQWTRTTGTNEVVSLSTSPTVSATAIGEYAVKLMRGTDTCTAYVTIRSKPCTPRTHTYDCRITPVIPMPDNGSRLSNLAPGDTIRAADFDIIVTEVSGGGSDSWNGVGYTEIPYLQDSKIAIELKGAVVNDCYELVGGTAQSVYDPRWGNLVNTDINSRALLGEIRTFLEHYTGKPDEITILNSYITTLGKGEADSTLSEVKQALIMLSQCGSTNNSGGRLAAISNNCPDVITEAKNTVVEVLDSITLAPENEIMQENVVALNLTESLNINNSITSYRLLGMAGISRQGNDFTPNSNLQPNTPEGRNYYDKFVLEWVLDSSPCETENPNTSACTTYLTEYSRLQRKLSQSKLCPQLTNNFLFDKLYSSLANANLISKTETAIAQRYTERYKQNNDSDYFDTQDLSSILLNKKVGKDLFNRIAGVFNIGMKVRKGDISKISLNNVLRNNPTFLPNLQVSDGVILLAFIGGTQQIEVRHVNTVFQQPSGIYDTELIVRIFDDFGVEEHDYYKPLLTRFDISASWVPAPLKALINDGKQGLVDKLMRGPLFAFWVLQHQRNIKPFRAVYTYKLTFRGNFN